MSNDGVAIFFEPVVEATLEVGAGTAIFAGASPIGSIPPPWSIRHQRSCRVRLGRPDRVGRPDLRALRGLKLTSHPS